MSDNCVLRLEHLTKHFGGVTAVKEVDLQVHKGEIHGLIGPNGAGKSTIFKLIIGVLEPSEGKIYYKGETLNGKKAWQRARMGIGIKMQIPGVFLDLPLYENIRIAAQAYHPAAQVESVVERIVKQVHLADLGDPLVRNMPHGQQQWLEIGMALACKPELLLLDEPAAGMGPEETEVTAQLIHELHESGITILFIDHDMDFVKRIAQRITVLHYGAIFEQGTAEQIENSSAVREIYLGKV